MSESTAKADSVRVVLRIENGRVASASIANHNQAWMPLRPWHCALRASVAILCRCGLETAGDREGDAVKLVIYREDCFG